MSPSGNDNNPGTVDSLWKTFGCALGSCRKVMSFRFGACLRRKEPYKYRITQGFLASRSVKMDRKELEIELELAQKTVEDACGVQVTALRAPGFTINRKNIWALQVLIETDLKNKPGCSLSTGAIGRDG